MGRSKENAKLIAEPFYNYLKGKGALRSYSKPQLKKEYMEFKMSANLPHASYNNVLWQLSRGRPKLAHVQNGYVYFQGTDDWSQRNRSRQRTNQVDNIPGGVNSERSRIFNYLKQNKIRDALLNENSSTVEITCSPAEVEEHHGYYTCNVEERKTFHMVVRNKCREMLVLKRCVFLRHNEIMTLSDKVGCTNLSNSTVVKMQPDTQYQITVTCIVPNQVGSYCSDTFFRFTKGDRPFLVLRYLRCYKANDIVDSLKPTAPYVRKTFAPEPPMEIVYCGEYEWATDDKLKMTRSLPNQPVPYEVERFCTKKEHSESDAMIKLLEKDVETIADYKKKFSVLLHMEEHQSSIDIQHYNLKEKTLDKQPGSSRKFLLKVPGLAERRPSILRGDRIYLNKSDAYGMRLELIKYEGRVIDVRLNEVVLLLNESFGHSYMKGMKFNVSFTFNRLPMKLQHRAVNGITADQREMIFPQTRLKEHMPDQVVKMYNRDIEGNQQQAEAVKHIVFGKSRIPYIIYGPPGTGKTVTMVEAIKQVHKFHPDYKFLVCAPSNSACDLMAERLIGHIDKKRMFRMCALSRPWRDVPEKIKPISNYNSSTGDYYYPSLETLKEYTVILTTLITAGRISSAEFPNNHFDYVFIDEAGHAVEPECMVAVEGVLAKSGRVVLAGDPKQLGPIIRSTKAKKFGLDQSYLERLMTTVDLYEPNGTEYDTWVITKLLNNYRSHPDIIKVPNECFYENELETHADIYMRESFCTWEHLPKSGFPIIFHGIQGEDKREENSPSYFNPQEASTVYDYVVKLLETRRNRVLPSEIGIISPYRKQVQKLRKMFKDKKTPGAEEIKIGSVEEFQGQERKVIIVSTVRSDCQYLTEDRKFHLGFLQNPKRFNVAVTRAKALLIVVGNPHILSMDFYWNSLLTFCIDNGGYKGIEFTKRDNSTDPAEDMISRMHDLRLEETLGISAVQEQLDPPWRNEQ
ncbi:putative helicase mov-10-B.1 [Ciona intestinalis]